jgi:hypothetical protein
MIVAQLTPEQAEQLKGVEFVQDSFFNPIQDLNGNYIISLEEQEQCNIDWVKELPHINYEPIVHELPMI